MEWRYASLRPAPRRAEDRPEELGLIEAPEAKKRRVGVSVACNTCRKKKIRCDGQRPMCTKCIDTTTQCAYRDESDLSDESKKLVIELIRILNNMPPSETVRTLRLFRTESNAPIILATLRNEAMLRDDALADYHRNASCSSTLEPLSHTECTTATIQASASSPCFDQLLSWKFCYPTFADDSSTLTPVYSTVLFHPAPPLDAYTPKSHLDVWTRTGWTRAHIRQLFDALLTWDSLPFCILSKEVFLWDYNNGSDQFCSSALVHALLALATRILNENKEDDDTFLSTGMFGSRFFLEEAETIFQHVELPSSLPNTQALGVLSLYELRCGRESEAQRLAKAFATRITELCRHEPLEGKGEQYGKVRAATYCSAISLTRMLSLATGQLFDVDYHASPDISLYLDDPSPHSRGTSPGNYDLKTDLNSNLHTALWRFDSIPQKLFQLTEWVHELITSAQSDTQTATCDVLPVYGRCLDWYKSFFSFLNADRSRTPFMLFIHMYYHFCLLCAFRPFIGQNMGDSDIEPRQICTQAAQSILTLAQSYDDLFSLRHVSGLIPYFVCASGLFSLAIGDSSSHMAPADSRPGGDARSVATTKPGKRDSSGAPYAASRVQSYINIPAAAHGRLLLARMGLTNPVATTAARVLEDEIKCTPNDLNA